MLLLLLHKSVQHCAIMQEMAQIIHIFFLLIYHASGYSFQYCICVIFFLPTLATFLFSIFVFPGGEWLIIVNQMFQYMEIFSESSVSQKYVFWELHCLFKSASFNPSFFLLNSSSIVFLLLNLTFNPLLFYGGKFEIFGL